jgi:SAM-dependent methyltransferase
MTAVRDWLAHPSTKGLHPDDPRTTKLRQNLVASKPFLRRIYLEWYEMLVNSLPPGEGKILELGSGAGFFRQVCPDAITSEIFFCDGISLILDARKLPFRDGSLRAIVMTDVMHHIPNPEFFLREARRTLQPGGRVLMIEPWVTPWSRFIYRWFHAEPFLPSAPTWDFPSSGPLSGANGAIPWMMFERDIDRFRNLFPEFHAPRIQPFMPFRYLASGGVSMRSLMPGWSFAWWRRFEGLLKPLMRVLAMFAFIRLDRR